MNPVKARLRQGVAAQYMHRASNCNAQSKEKPI